MAAISTTQTFSANEQITSTKLTNILANSIVVDGAITSDGTLILVNGQLQVGLLKIENFPIGVINSTNISCIADASIPSTKLTPQNSLVPAGAVMPFAMNSAPIGWLICNGAAVSRTTYAALFALLSTVYGSGDGTNTFNVPDLRGYFLRGLDGRTSGNIDPTSGRTIGTLQDDAVGPLELSGNTPSDFFSSTNTGSPGGGAVRVNMYSGASNTFSSKPVTVTASNTETETRPKNIAMLYCIKY